MKIVIIPTCATSTASTCARPMSSRSGPGSPTSSEGDMDWTKIENIVKEAILYSTLSVGAPLPQREVDRIAAEAVKKMKAEAGQ